MSLEASPLFIWYEFTSDFCMTDMLSRLSSAVCLIVCEGSASSTFGKIKSGVEPVIVTVHKEMLWLKIFTYVIVTSMPFNAIKFIQQLR